MAKTAVRSKSRSSKRRSNGCTETPKSERWLDPYLTAAQSSGCPVEQVGNFVRARILLQPKQLSASAAARACDQPDGPVEIGYGGSRGGGKSFWGIAQLAADDCQRFPGLKALVLRKVGKANRENFEDLRRRMLGSVPHRYRRQEGVVEFPNGSRIITGHFQNENDIDAYLGLEYDVILVEEATTLTKAKYDDISSCNRTSKPGWRPRIYSTTNPGGVGHQWYKQRFVDPYRKRTERDTRFIPATADDNKFNNPEYARRLDGLTGWKLRAWRYGDWDIAAGQFFTTFRRDVHVVPSIEVPGHWRVWLSLDYGFTHFTVVYLCASNDSGRLYYIDEHAERGWLVEDHCEAIRAMLDRNNVREGRLETIVAGHDVFSKERDGRTIADDYADHGLILERANVDRIQGAAELLRRLGDPERGKPATLEISERCGRLIECLPALEHNPRRPEDVLKVDPDEDGLGGDDAYDSARYASMYLSGTQAAWVPNPLGDRRW